MEEPEGSDVEALLEQGLAGLEVESGSESGEEDPESLEQEEEEAFEYLDENNDDDDEDEELPPMLEPPSTGYLHYVDENQPPPILEPEVDIGTGPKKVKPKPKKPAKALPVPPVRKIPEIKLWDSDVDRSSTTDSDDELVKVDYLKNPPKKFQKMLKKYKFIRSKDSWMYGIQNFYKKQPSNVRKLLKMRKDPYGNPIEEPIGVLFERFYAERERTAKANNIKVERQEPPPRVTPVVSFKVDSSEPRLIHVAYPANVVNEDKALATLGGLRTISNIFEQPNKKLALKFRPNDPFANCANAPGRKACGLLLKVRRRKVPTPMTQEEVITEGCGKINLDCAGDDPISVEDMHDMLFDNPHLICQPAEKSSASDPKVLIGGKEYDQQQLLWEDKRLTDARAKRVKSRRAWGRGFSKDFNLQIPEKAHLKDDDVQVETIGIVHRSYEFTGLCDFQYLPVMKKSDGEIASIKDKIFPMLGRSDNPEKLVCKDLINDESQCHTFILPPAMSRLDNPTRGLFDDIVASDKADTAAKKAPPDDSIFSNRLKRIIYTISYNFQAENPPPGEIDVPDKPLNLALKDIERRQIKKELIDLVRAKFSERPIWSKAALEFATKIPALTLKYIIPYFAYFASNGPWRNTWIKFGVDPRRIQSHVIYQSVDFRVPFIYRRFMNVAPKNPEAIHKYLREYMPPKTQMFYQLCDIKLEEIKELIETLNKKAEANSLVYEDRFGFLKEGTYEYFRYILTYYLENLLQEYGKIPESTPSEVTFKIPPGEIEPTSKLKAAPHRRVKVKRIRKSAKKTDTRSAKPVAKKVVGKKKPAKGAKSVTRQETLEDLALNDLPNDSSNEGADIFESH